MTMWLLIGLLLTPQTGRDSSAAGGAIVSGVVVSDDGSDRPARHALVALSGNSNTTTTSMITGDDGAFAFAELRPGSYRLTVSKPGFQTTEFGMRPGRDIGTPIAVEAGQRVTGLRVPLRRGAVISGIVSGPNGEPVMAATVSAAQMLSPSLAPLTRGGVPVIAAQATTDDTGRYRLYGLADGEYAILASTVADKDSVLYAPTARPTVGASEGPTVSVRAGDERDGVDVRMRIAPPARVQGTLIDQDGRPAAGRSIQLDSGAGPAVILSGERPMSAMIADDGSFTFAGVPAGTYDVHYEEGLRSEMTGPPYRPAFWARSSVVVDGKDVAGLLLTLRRATPVSGRLIVDRSGDTTPPPFNVSLANLDVGDIVFTKVSADGTFAFPGAMPGRHRVDVTSDDSAKRSQWRLSGATARGRSVLGGDLIVAGDAITDVTVTVSDDVGAVRGSIANASGSPAPEYLIVLFPDTTAPLTMPDVRVVAPDTNGNWLVAGRVPGAYRVAAISEWTTQTALTPTLIEQLRAASTPVTITRGGTVTVPLRIGKD